MPRSTNRPSRSVEPEVWFRIVHVGMHGQNPVSHANGPIYRDQTVEITLGPKGAFENSNVGALSRRVAAGLIVNAVPAPRGKPKPPKSLRTPRVVELLQKAIEWRTQIESGNVASQAAIARREGITRARVTQVLGLLRLAPAIRKQILSMPDDARQPAISERVLRPIARMEQSEAQIEAMTRLWKLADDPQPSDHSTLHHRGNCSAKSAS